MDTDKLFNDVLHNALDFLDVAIRELDAGNGKHSVIAFYSAVELFLKARLLKEHWTLIVSNKPDLKQFENGNFISVGFDEACLRLDRVCDSAVPADAIKAFDELRKYRNKLVHFVLPPNDSLTDAVAVELRAWYQLIKLLAGRWTSAYKPIMRDIYLIDRKLHAYRKYLEEKFHDIKPLLAELRQAGKVIEICRSCGMEAAVVTTLVSKVHSSTCYVCESRDTWADIKCPGCGTVGRMSEGLVLTCGECGRDATEEEVKEQLDDNVVTPDNYFDFVPISCSFCESYHAVVHRDGKYLCINCLTVTDDYSVCDWCNEGVNGHLEDSYLTGCGFCDGKIGHDGDKD